MSKEVKLIREFVDKRAERNREALNKSFGGYKSDSNRDVTEYLKGVSAAYASVKYFIDMGLREVPG